MIREQWYSPDTDCGDFADAERDDCYIIHSQYVRGRENIVEPKDNKLDLPKTKSLSGVHYL